MPRVRKGQPERAGERLPAVCESMSELHCLDCGYAGPYDEVRREGRTTSACPECDGFMERFDGPPGGDKLCPECKAAMHLHEQGYCPYEIETGERITESPLTGETYKVTRWVEPQEGRIIALQKKPVDSKLTMESEP